MKDIRRLFESPDMNFYDSKRNYTDRLTGGRLYQTEPKTLHFVYPQSLIKTRLP